VQLIFLMARGVHRHCRLLESLAGASKKMMTEPLVALAEWGEAHRGEVEEARRRHSRQASGVTEPALAAG